MLRIKTIDRYSVVIYFDTKTVLYVYDTPAAFYRNENPDIVYMAPKLMAGQARGISCWCDSIGAKETRYVPIGLVNAACQLIKSN